MRMLRVATILTGLGLAAACGAAGDEGDEQALCSEGATRTCDCDTDRSGVATCANEAWSACVCEGAGGAGGSGGVGGEGGGVGGAGGTAGAGGTGEVVEPVCVQFAGQGAGLPHCEAMPDESISAVCTLDGCADAGERGAAGLLRGSILLYAFSDPVLIPVPNIKSYQVQLYYPTTSLDEQLDCETILAAEDWFDPSWNLVMRSAGPVPSPGHNTEVYVPNLPVNDEGTPFLVQLAFYGGNRDTNGVPTGQVIAVTCTAGIVVQPDPFVKEGSRTFSVTMERP